MQRSRFSVARLRFEAVQVEVVRLRKLMKIPQQL
jgi:hypothetical protein